MSPQRAFGTSSGAGLILARCCPVTDDDREIVLTILCDIIRARGVRDPERVLEWIAQSVELPGSLSRPQLVELPISLN